MKNMKTLNLISGLVLVTAITVVSCTKSNVSPSASSVNFKIQATSKTQPVSKALLASNLANNSLAWDTALLVVSKIELEAEKHGNSGSDNKNNSASGKDGKAITDKGNDTSTSDSSKVNFEWNGPKKIDLFNLNSDIGGVSLVPGTFNNLTIKIESFKSDAGSSPLFYLAGNYTNSTGAVKRINVIINQDFEFRITKTDTLSSVHDYTSVIKMNLVLLFSDVMQAELDNAVLTDDKLVISSTSNVTLFDKILTNLHTSGESEFERD
jgi:hypothetical protein